MSLRVLVVPNDVPLPANSGGRIDVWRRLQVLHGLGAQLGLLSWYDAPRDGAPPPAVLAQLNSLCGLVSLSPIRRGAVDLARRLVHAGRLPSHAASRWTSINQTDVLAQVQAFRPQVLLLDGLYGAAVVRWLSARLGVPWVYRSHNIEHLYMRRQLDSARHWRARLGLAANLWGLQRFESAVLGGARQVLDISQADQAFWQARGHRQVQWLPTVVDTGFSQAMAQRAAQPPACDALYFGNLHTPNNVAAVRWLVQQVLPLLGGRRFSLVLAGSRPSDEVRALAATDARITLLPDPPDMAAVAGSARVLLNPVQAGSGVNLKSVEMLFSTAQLVSTSVGVQGLQAEAVACFVVGDGAPAFAQALGEALDRPALSAAALVPRAQARRVFEPAHAAGLLLGALQPAAGVAA